MIPSDQLNECRWLPREQVGHSTNQAGAQRAVQNKWSCTLSEGKLINMKELKSKGNSYQKANEPSNALLIKLVLLNIFRQNPLVLLWHCLDAFLQILTPIHLSPPVPNITKGYPPSIDRGSEALLCWVFCDGISYEPGSHGKNFTHIACIWMYVCICMSTTSRLCLSGTCK